MLRGSLKRGTLALSWGPSGGFYVTRNRICLGWVALTLVPRVEVEDMMRAYIDEPKLLARIHGAPGTRCRSCDGHPAVPGTLLRCERPAGHDGAHRSRYGGGVTREWQDAA